jgi:hypothetical protein
MVAHDNSGNGFDDFDWGDDPGPPPEVAQAETATAVADEDNTTEPEPTKATKPKAAKESEKRISELTFDLETVPDQARFELFESFLPPLPEPYQARGFAGDGDSNGGITAAELPDVLSGSIDDIKAWIKATSPAPEVVAAMREIEDASKKPRKGVYDALDNALSAVSAYDNAVADRMKLLSTTPEFCSIAAFGFAVDDDDPVAMMATNEAEEREILELFWKLAARADLLCGFNVVGFDLPVILARSAILGVPSSCTFDLRWGKGIRDIYLSRFGSRGNTDKRKPGRLKDLARVYGVEIPAGNFEGSQVAAAMETEEGRAKVAEYCCSDVEITRELGKVWAGYFC